MTDGRVREAHMNICFMLGGFSGNGGIGRVTSMLAGELAKKKGFRIFTLSYVSSGKPDLYEVSGKVEQYFLLNEYKSMTRTLLTGGIQKLKAFLQEKHIDVLVACGALFFPICVCACRTIQTKCICWEHTNPKENHDYRAQAFARRYGIRHSDCNVVLTREALDIYRNEFHAGKTVQIYNPVDARLFECAGEYDAASRKIISVGRLSYPKNFRVVIEIAATLLERHPQWEWDIFGEGEEGELLSGLIREKNLEGRVHLRGQVNDLYARYSEYSFMVMTSRYEGFPMSLLEGMANGLPLVSFDIPTGPKEIIQDDENGFLVPPLDTEAMEARLEQLIRDVHLRERLGRNGKVGCEKFSQQKITQRWVRLFEDLLADRALN